MHTRVHSTFIVSMLYFCLMHEGEVVAQAHMRARFCGLQSRCIDASRIRVVCVCVLGVVDGVTHVVTECMYSQAC